MNEQYKDVAIYKPTKSTKGGALQIKPSVNKETGIIECLYLEAAKQSGDRLFDWNTKVVMKLGIVDISKMMTVFSGREAKCNLFHKSAAGSSTLDIAPNQGVPGFYLKTSSTASGIQVGVPLSNDEAELLLALLRGIVPKLYGWN